MEIKENIINHLHLLHLKNISFEYSFKTKLFVMKLFWNIFFSQNDLKSLHLFNGTLILTNLTRLGLITVNSQTNYCSSLPNKWFDDAKAQNHQASFTDSVNVADFLKRPTVVNMVCFIAALLLQCIYLICSYCWSFSHVFRFFMNISYFKLFSQDRGSLFVAWVIIVRTIYYVIGFWNFWCECIW